MVGAGVGLGHWVAIATIGPMSGPDICSPIESSLPGAAPLTFSRAPVIGADDLPLKWLPPVLLLTRAAAALQSQPPDLAILFWNDIFQVSDMIMIMASPGVKAEGSNFRWTCEPATR